MKKSMWCWTHTFLETKKSTAAAYCFYYIIAFTITTITISTTLPAYVHATYFTTLGSMCCCQGCNFSSSYRFWFTLFIDIREQADLFCGGPRSATKGRNINTAVATTVTHNRTAHVPKALSRYFVWHCYSTILTDEIHFLDLPSWPNG